ncbi:MAG: hypothetical protein KBG28_19570 [Kofleriaceae bacterium]|nr:hypothetical protein [Kofleriaceae bacterium]
MVGAGHDFERLSTLARLIGSATDDTDATLALASALPLVDGAGPVVVPLLCRELTGPCDHRRAVARGLLLAVAEQHPARVIAAARAALRAATDDVGKVAALGVLAALDAAPVNPEFVDPGSVQRRSAVQLARHLETAADVASAAQLMVEQLDADETRAVIAAMLDESPARGRRLAGELAARLDLEPELRGDLRRAAAATPSDGAAADRILPARPASTLAMYVHPSGRRAIVASKRVAIGAFRHFAVLVDAEGALADCLYLDDAPADALRGELLGGLGLAGYRRLPLTAARARERVVGAARGALGLGRTLPPAYYLGRDLLGITADHLSPRDRAADDAALHGRAVELLASGQHALALPMLERCARRCAGDADVWSSLGTCLAALGQHLRADDAFRRAARLDPTYPLHHWNAAAIARQLGDLDRCYRALRRFLDLSDRPGRAPVAAVDADRVGTAQQIVADLERTARLTGRPLPAPPLPVRAARPTATRRRPTARP